jgi:hypothetical protein
MKKPLFTLLSAAILLVCIPSCAQTAYPDLPDAAIAFDMGSYTDTNDNDATYATIEYEGRTYLPYGTINQSFQVKDVDQCVGYIVEEENSSSDSDESDTDTRVYTLTDDPDHNYLVVYYVGSTLMDQPDFLRAVDTAHEDISTPEYIDSLEYAFWE